MKHNKTNATNIAATLAAAIIMIFALLLAPTAAQAQTTILVGDETALRSAITSYNNGYSDVIISITESFTITSSLPELENNNGRTLTIIGD